jgi:hypothetical protein
VVLGIRPDALSMLGKCLFTELHPQYTNEKLYLNHAITQSCLNIRMLQLKEYWRLNLHPMTWPRCTNPSVETHWQEESLAM